jgi:aminoglycoside 6'-N-acetyltransferase I
MNVTVRSVRPEDRSEWLRMRKALWDESPDEEQEREMDEELARDTDEIFFAERPGGGLCGFLEARLRPMVDGVTEPVRLGVSEPESLRA